VTAWSTTSWVVTDGGAGGVAPAGVGRLALVEDVAAAVAQVLDLGGSVVREPGFFREPGTPDPVLEWAVLADPFGNELCLIRELPEPDAPS
jgi:hypothetical protein